MVPSRKSGTRGTWRWARSLPRRSVRMPVLREDVTPPRVCTAWSAASTSRNAEMSVGPAGQAQGARAGVNGAVVGRLLLDVGDGCVVGQRPARAVQIGGVARRPVVQLGPAHRVHARGFLRPVSGAVVDVEGPVFGAPAGIVVTGLGVGTRGAGVDQRDHPGGAGPGGTAEGFLDIVQRTGGVAAAVAGHRLEAEDVGLDDRGVGACGGFAVGVGAQDFGDHVAFGAGKAIGAARADLVIEQPQGGEPETRRSAMPAAAGPR